MMKQEETLNRLETFLGIPLSRIVVRPEAVARWQKETYPVVFPYELFREILVENGYPLTQ